MAIPLNLPRPPNPGKPPRRRRSVMGKVARGAGWLASGPLDWAGVRRIRRSATFIGDLATLLRHGPSRDDRFRKDGVTGVTYLAEVPMSGDPHAHVHHAMFNMVATEGGRVGSLDTRRLQDRVHEFGAYFQGRLAGRLRELGMRTAYDAKEEAFVLPAVPQAAVDLFSKGRRQTERNAKAYAKRQGLDWEALPAQRKFGILSAAAVAERRSKGDGRTERETWRDQAEAIGWTHATVLEGAEAPVMADAERFNQAYDFAARHLATEFDTAAVIDHSRLRTYAARGLIQTGASEPEDIDRWCS